MNKLLLPPAGFNASYQGEAGMYSSSSIQGDITYPFQVLDFELRGTVTITGMP